MGTKIFDLVTLKFDLLLKNCNLGHDLLTRRGRAFIFHMYIPCDEAFPWYQHFYLVPFTLNEVWPTNENCNLGHNFLTRRGRVFVFRMCIPCDKTLSTVPLFFDLVTLTLQVDHFSKILFWTMTLEAEELFVVAIYIWLPPTSYVVFLTTLVSTCIQTTVYYQVVLMLVNFGLDVYEIEKFTST